MNSIDIVTIIDPNATAVSVQASVSGRKYRVTGSAKREKGDIRNPDIGQALAVARAFRELADQLETDGRALVEAGEQAKRDVVSKRIERTERRARGQARELLTIDEIAGKYGPEAATRALARRANTRLLTPVPVIPAGSDRLA